MKNQIISTTDLMRNINALPNPSEILRSKMQTMQLYDKVAKHIDIYPVLNNYRDAVCAMTVNATLPFFEDYLATIDLHKFIRQAITARDYGFSVLEVIEYGTFNGKTVPTKIAITPHHVWFFDRDLNLRLRTTSNSDGILVNQVYPNKFILVQHENTITNPYGIANLDIAYWTAVGLNGNFEFLMQFIEEDGRSKWLGTYPAETPDIEKAQLLEAGINLRNNAVAIMKEGMTLEQIDAGGRQSSTDLYMKTNDMLLRKVEKLWYGTDLTVQQDKGGYSSSQSGIDIREDALNQGKLIAINALQSLYQLIVGINGMSNEALQVNMFSPRETTKEEAETDQIYFAMGLKPTQKFFENRGYNPDEFTLDNVILSGAKNPKQNAQFSNANADLDKLINAFDIYASGK